MLLVELKLQHLKVNPNQLLRVMLQSVRAMDNCKLGTGIRHFCRSQGKTCLWLRSTMPVAWIVCVLPLLCSAVDV